MKKLHFIAQAKRGVGKSLLMYLFALKNHHKPDCFFVDLDSSTHTTKRQLHFVDEKQFDFLSLIDEKGFLIRDNLISYLEAFAASRFNEIYFDMGAPESEQLLSLIEYDIPMKAFMDALDYQVSFHIVIGGGGAYNASIEYLLRMVDLVKTDFEIIVWQSIATFRKFPHLTQELIDPSLYLKKCQKYLRKNSIWHRGRINDPYQAIAEFFDSTSVVSFETELYGILRACSENHPCQKDSPADVIYFFEKLESIINAGYIIYKMSRRSSVNMLDTTEIVPSFYGQRPNDTETSATSFIGVDSEEMNTILNEFFDYKSLKQWKEELYEICMFSLSNQAARLWTVWIDSLPIYAHIIKLVECLKSSQSLSRLTKD